MPVLTSECFLDVHHFPRTGLHESIPSSPRPFQSFSCANLSHTLQIAFVSRNQTYRYALASFHTVLALLFDQLVKILQRFESILLGDIVDQQEGIGVEVGVRPETAVFFLSRSVGQVEGVCRSVNGARHGVGVFDRWVVPASC